MVLNNLDLESLPATRKDEIEKFVQQGGGLLVIAGERNVYAEDKTVEDALDRTLAGQARSSSIARRHRGRTDHRQIVFHGR